MQRRHHPSLLVATTLLCALLLPLNALAQDDDGGGEEEGGEAEAQAKASGDKKDGKKKKQRSDVQDADNQEALAAGVPIVSADRNWTLSASIGTRIGQGTFVDPSNDTDLDVGEGSNSFDLASMFYSFRPSYTLGNFVINSSISLTHFLTAAGQSLSPPNEPNDIRISDLSFDLFWFGKTFKTGTNISLDVGFSLPLSPASRISTMIIDPFIAGIIRQPIFRRIFLVGSVAGGKTFHRFTSPVSDLSDAGEDNLLFRANGAEDLGDGLIAVGGRNIEFFLSSRATAAVILTRNLNVSMSYRYATFWTYKAGIDEEDEFTPRNGMADTGRGRGDIVSGSIGTSYQPLPWLFLSASLSSVQPPKTSDNRSFRFPFWNFEGAAANRSAINFGARVVY